MTRVQWVGRTDLAEVAEALGVPSDMVMAVHSDGTVLWTENDFVFRAQLGRDADGIIVVGPRQMLMPVEEFKSELGRIVYGDEP